MLLHAKQNINNHINRYDALDTLHCNVSITYIYILPCFSTV